MNAPRVTEADVENAIESEWYLNGGSAHTDNDFSPPVPHNSPLHLLTICVLVLKNGFTVIGKSACVSPENYNEAIGRSIARANAVREIWPLMGFRLAEQLAMEQAVPQALPPADEAYDQPVLGNQVLYFEQVGDHVSAPMVATICAVHGPKMVSLSVLAPNGTVHGRTSVNLFGPWEDVPPDLSCYARRK